MPVCAATAPLTTTLQQIERKLRLIVAQRRWAAAKRVKRLRACVREASMSSAGFRAVI
jgi:hypothetical protein